MEVFLAGLLEVNTIYEVLSDYTRVHFPVVAYKLIDVTVDQLDDVHLEIDDLNKVFQDEVELRTYVVPDEEQYQLSKFGLERARDVVLQVAVPDLIEAGLASMDTENKVITINAGPGDRFHYSGSDYDVIEVYRGDMWGNTDIPIYFYVNADRRRPSSYDYVNHDNSS